MNENPNLPPNTSQDDIDGDIDEFGQYYIESSVAFWCDSIEDRDKIMSAMENTLDSFNGETDYVEINACTGPNE